MLLSKFKGIIKLIILLEIFFLGAPTKAMTKRDDISKVYTASLVESKRIESKSNNVKNDSEVLVTKEINCPKIGLNLLMDVPKSWEGKYYVKEYSYVYEVGTYTVSDGNKVEKKYVQVIFKDPETKFEFPLITIIPRNSEALEELYLDNTIIKNFNGKEYVIGGPTGEFDKPKSALSKYIVMHKESIKVMNSIRNK